jgi:hypothetical protein
MIKKNKIPEIKIITIEDILKGTKIKYKDESNYRNI